MGEVNREIPQIDFNKYHKELCGLENQCESIKQIQFKQLKNIARTKRRELLLKSQLKPLNKKDGISGSCLECFQRIIRKNQEIFFRENGKQKIKDAKNIPEESYFWIENDQIIASKNPFLMDEKIQNEKLKAIIPKELTPGKEKLFLEKIRITLQVAQRSPFQLLAQDLHLLKQVCYECLKNTECWALLPNEFDEILTNIRREITFNFISQISGKNFDFRRNFLINKSQEKEAADHDIGKILGTHQTPFTPNPNYQEEYKNEIKEASKNYQIPIEWIHEIVWIESQGDPKALSGSEAWGLMQLKELVFRGFGKKRAKESLLTFEKSINPLNPKENINRGAEYLKNIVKFLKPTLEQVWGKNLTPEIIHDTAFYAFNAGPPRVKQTLIDHGKKYLENLPAETQKYLENLKGIPKKKATLEK